MALGGARGAAGQFKMVKEDSPVETKTTKRSVGRPQLRWRDDIQKIAGKNLTLAARSRDLWKQMEEAYIQEWMATG